MSSDVAASDLLQEYCSRFQSLHCDQHEGRPRPHKAVMLLAVLALTDADADRVIPEKAKYWA